MLITVKRKSSDGVATMGEMFIDGVHECFTLEPPNPIAAGTYDLIIDDSIRFKRPMPHVMDVPDHTGIRIHWGNWRKDTEDCTLVGSTTGEDFIGNSVDTFNQLFAKLETALKNEKISITYENGD